MNPETAMNTHYEFGNQRIIAIGDIHGCSRALAALIKLIAPTSSDILIQLGDAIDRGPDSRSVMEQLIELSSRCTLIYVRGNHEELLLNSLEDAAALPRWLRNGGFETLRSYDCDDPRFIPKQHLDFIRSSIDYLELENFIFIHAGYVENQPMAEQLPLALRWRVTNANSRPHLSGKVIIAGHTPQMSGDILHIGHARCIDTNCVHGGWLTAMEVVSKQVWQCNQAGALRQQ